MIVPSIRTSEGERPIVRRLIDGSATASSLIKKENPKAAQSNASRNIKGREYMTDIRLSDQNIQSKVDIINNGRIRIAFRDNKSGKYVESHKTSPKVESHKTSQ